MQLTNLLVVAAAFASFTAAMPSALAEGEAVGLTMRAACGNPGPCNKNNCKPKYNNKNDVYGTCTSGRYDGCRCSKCAGQTDKCSKNGCKGSAGKCTAGDFQGCACKI